MTETTLLLVYSSTVSRGDTPVHLLIIDFQLSPIQQELSSLSRSPAPPRVSLYEPSAYTTPVQSHTMSSPYFVKRRLPNYDSNRTDDTNDNNAPSALAHNKETPLVDLQCMYTIYIYRYI